MSNNRPPASRPPGSQPSSRRDSERYYDDYYGSSSDRRGSSRSGSQVSRPTGNSRGAAASSLRSGGGRGQAPSSARNQNGRGPSSPRSQGSRPGGRPPGGNGRPGNKRRKRRSSPLSRILTVVLLAAIVLIIALVLRSCISGGQGDDGTYALVFNPSQTLLIGESATVTVAGLPEDFDGKIVWMSSDAETVRISDSGTITGLKLGEVTISANVNKKAVTSTVQVIEMLEGVESVTLNRGSVSIVSGQSFRLLATVTMEGNALATNAQAKWSSSNPNVARVNSDGLIAAKDVGTATITATVGNRSAACLVTVVADSDSQPAQNTEGNTPAIDPEEDNTSPDENGAGGDDENGGDTAANGSGSTATGGGSSGITVSSLALSQPFAYLSVGESMTLGATTSPVGVLVAWSSSNPSVATVSDSGVVTAKSVGSVIITATAGGHSAQCPIEVSAADDSIVEQTQGDGAGVLDTEPSPNTPD